MENTIEQYKSYFHNHFNAKDVGIGVDYEHVVVYPKTSIAELKGKMKHAGFEDVMELQLTKDVRVVSVSSREIDCKIEQIKVGEKWIL